MNYGERLRYARKRAGLSQQALAELSGVGQGSISKIERGDQDRSIHDIALSKALNVDPVWLATGEGAMTGAQPTTALERVQARPTIRLDLLAKALEETEVAFAILGATPTTEQRAEAAALRYEALLAESATTSAPLAAAS